MKRFVCFLSLIFLIAGFVCFQVFWGEPSDRKFHAGAETIAINNAIDASGVSSAILIEANTGALLFEKNADQKLPMASMTKMMTLKIVFDEIAKGRLSFDKKVKISAYAASQTGSEAFLDEKAEYSIEDLVRTTVIVSANDSSVALAEAVCGSEKAFVARMNQYAATLGMENTHFENATGLPAAGHFSSARDMATLAKLVVFDPCYKKYSKTYLDELVHPSGRKTSLVGTNRQLKNYSGFEGGKTGHTNEAGYCIAAGAKRGDMRLVSVVMGGVSSEKRFDTTKALFDFGFDNFKTKEVLKTNKPLATRPIENGKDAEMNVFAKESFVVFMNKEDKFEFDIEIDVTNSKVPLKAGETVGKVGVVSLGEQIFETDLVVQKDYPHVGWRKVFMNIVNAF